MNNSIYYIYFLGHIYNFFFPLFTLLTLALTTNHNVRTPSLSFYLATLLFLYLMQWRDCLCF